MALRTFVKSYQKQSVFKCGLCARATRDVEDNGDVQLCPQCYEACGIENEISDGHYAQGPKLQAAQQQVKALHALAVSKGGVLR